MSKRDERARRRARRHAERAPAGELVRRPSADWLAEPESTTAAPWRELWHARRVPLIAILVLALAVRLIVLAAIARTPYIEVGNIEIGRAHV